MVRDLQYLMHIPHINTKVLLLSSSILCDILKLMALSATSNTAILNSTSTKFPPAAGIIQQHHNALMDLYLFFSHTWYYYCKLILKKSRTLHDTITQSVNKVRNQLRQENKGMPIKLQMTTFTSLPLFS